MLDLPPEVEDRLRDNASRAGISIADLITSTFPPVSVYTPVSHVIRILEQWQAIDNTHVERPATYVEGRTPSGALFSEWDAEDSPLTEEERRSEDSLWQDFTAGINEERARAGMRLIF